MKQLSLREEMDRIDKIEKKPWKDRTYRERKAVHLFWHHLVYKLK